MTFKPIDSPDLAIREIQNILDAQSLTGSVESCLRFQPNRVAILKGCLHGSPTIFRLALSEQARKSLESTWEELERIGPIMRTGRYQVAQGLGFWKDHGLLAIQEVEGQTLVPLLSQKSQSVSVSDLANWLEVYSSPTIKTRPVNTAHWIKQARQSAFKQPHAGLREREDRILSVMTSLASRMQNETWRVAITHGDYHPNNLIWNQGILTGIDIGGSAYLPIYKDMARSLVHLARRNILENGPARFGVNDPLIRAYCERFALSNVEATVMLPFFIGFEFLIKVELADAPIWRINAATKMYDRFLHDVD